MSEQVNLFLDNLVVIFHPKEGAYPNSEPKLFYSEYSYESYSYHMLEINFNYDSNGAIGLCWCCFPKSECLGYHLEDSESIFILFDKINSMPQHVYFKAHGMGQGMWRKWEECEKINNSLLVYAARESHAFYPTAGIWWRACIFAPDLCGDSCIFGTGRRVNYNIKNIPISGRITKDIPRSSITYCERCCLCCCLSDIRNKK